MKRSYHLGPLSTYSYCGELEKAFEANSAVSGRGREPCCQGGMEAEAL